MNDKQKLIDDILDIVVECCRIEVYDIKPITKEDVLSQDRHENVNMTRCIFVTQMIFTGFSRTTIANILHRSEKTIGNILKQSNEYKKRSPAYRFAEAESTIKLKKLLS